MSFERVYSNLKTHSIASFRRPYVKLFLRFIFLHFHRMKQPNMHGGAS